VNLEEINKRLVELNDSKIRAYKVIEELRREEMDLLKILEGVKNVESD